MTCSKISGKAEVRWDRACLLLLFHCETLHTHTHTHTHVLPCACISAPYCGGAATQAVQDKEELEEQNSALKMQLAQMKTSLQQTIDEEVGHLTF